MTTTQKPPKSAPIGNSIVPPMVPAPNILPVIPAKKVGSKIDPKVQAATYKEFNSLSVTFSPATEAWILRGKSGQFRLMDKADIAVCLWREQTKIPIDETGTFSRKEFSKLRKGFNKLDGQIKLEWNDKAQAIFSPARKEYHNLIHSRISAAMKDKRLQAERYQFQVTKGGIVHVASRLTHRPEAK